MIKPCAYPLLLTGLMFISCSGNKETISENIFSSDTLSFEIEGMEADWDEEKAWDGASGGIRSYGLYAPPHGKSYAYQLGEGSWISRETGYTIKAGESYTLKLWSRSVNKAGNTATTIIKAGFLSKEKSIITREKNVNAPQLKGVAASEANDDGANIWVDGEYRHQFNEVHMYQSLGDDPLKDPWKVVENSGYDRISRALGWAVGNVIAGEHKYIYGTLYQDRPPWHSSLTVTRVISENPPDYQWTDPELVLEHAGSEFPWVLDAHGYYDESTGKLWMSWGGGICYVTEMDPASGFIKGNPESKEFDDHPEGMHTALATWPETRDGWDGDEWSNAWNEGPALYKRNGFWYFLASYGHLGKNYTIRVGRGKSPTGPFYDKQGTSLMEFDTERNTYGNTMLLGAEGDQLVPGHPHIWEENGNYFMGFDFRRDGSEEMDYMGIRPLYWIDNWPSIWMPVEITLKADDFPEFIGEKLKIGFRNAGEAGSELGVDLITISVNKNN